MGYFIDELIPQANRRGITQSVTLKAVSCSNSHPQVPDTVVWAALLQHILPTVVVCLNRHSQQWVQSTTEWSFINQGPHQILPYLSCFYQVFCQGVIQLANKSLVDFIKASFSECPCSLSHSEVSGRSLTLSCGDCWMRFHPSLSRRKHARIAEAVKWA